MKIIIKNFNNNWIILINKCIIINIIIKKYKKTKKLSLNLSNYVLIIKLIKQFGLIK